ncbi:MAG: hypothetical protein HFJ57_00720 [Clostridia bacterium]|nr:hypothetical protein [Clostridia bacterium]
MTNRIIQETLEKEQKIKELNSVLVSEFGKAIKTSNIVEIKQRNVVINFSLQRIPESLRDLFKERLNVLSGEISNDGPMEDRRYFYCRRIEVDGDNVTAKLIRNW